jgi:hypothetical protein
MDLKKLTKVMILSGVALCVIGVACPNLGLACDWSVGRYGHVDGSGKIVIDGRNPLPTGECTWFADGSTDRNGWDLVFRVSSGRDAYLWYVNRLILNSKLGTIGLPGDLLILNRSTTISGLSHGHVARIVSSGYWNGKRAWTVRHANWTGTYGQTNVESHCSRTIKQCTFVESSPGWVKIQNSSSLGATAYPLAGFLYKP